MDGSPFWILLTVPEKVSIQSLPVSLAGIVGSTMNLIRILHLVFRRLLAFRHGLGLLFGRVELLHILMDQLNVLQFLFHLVGNRAVMMSAQFKQCDFSHGILAHLVPVS